MFVSLVGITRCIEGEKGREGECVSCDDGLCEVVGVVCNENKGTSWDSGGIVSFVDCEHNGEESSSSITNSSVGVST